MSSRELFNKWQAQRWWAENYDKVMELYNVQQFNHQTVPLPTPPRSEDEVSLFTVNTSKLCYPVDIFPVSVFKYASFSYVLGHELTLIYFQHWTMDRHFIYSFCSIFLKQLLWQCIVQYLENFIVWTFSILVLLHHSIPWTESIASHEILCGS